MNVYFLCLQRLLLGLAGAKAKAGARRDHCVGFLFQIGRQDALRVAMLGHHRASRAIRPACARDLFVGKDENIVGRTTEEARTTCSVDPRKLKKNLTHPL